MSSTVGVVSATTIEPPSVQRVRSSKRLAWGVFGLSAVLVLAGELLEVLNLVSPHSSGSSLLGGHVSSGVAFGLAYLSYAVMGALIATKRPGNRVAWIMLGVGAFAALDYFATEYANYALKIAPGTVPGGVAMAWVENWTTPIWLGLGTIYLLLLFPDGRVPFRWGHPVAWLGVVAIAAIAVPGAFAPGPLRSFYGHLANPLGISGTGSFLNNLHQIGHALLPACSIAAAFVALMRFRRSRGDERLQMKWFATAALISALVYASDSIVRAHKPELAGTVDNIGTVSAFIVPCTVAVAILKFRLWDIDVFISKTVVFAAMGVFITVVYVGIVVGIGAALGNAGSRPSVALSIFATAVVAVGFQPVLERAKRFGNRLVYGKRATPYEVLAEFSDRLGRTYATEDVLLNMARTIAEGIGARRANVWLRNASELRLAASWPAEPSAHEPPLALVHGQLPAPSGVDRAVPVRHQDKLLGAITIVKPPAEPLSSTEDKLLNDLASQAGLVLRNVRLTAELVDRLEELTASRQRLIAAQDEARRRLERNIHDGAQQHLVALKVRLGMAERLAGGNARLKEALETLQLRADEALEALRDTAHGIYPPLLAERGLGVALKSQLRRFEVPAEIYADDLERYPEDVEAAVYFCCLEALQNVAKYAQAHRVTVRISERGGLLHFIVEDDGIGFDRESAPPGAGLMNMADRLAALGGTLEIRSTPGDGTCVTGEVPTEARLQPGIASMPEMARA